jgi:hypothetical protein
VPQRTREAQPRSELETDARRTSLVAFLEVIVSSVAEFTFIPVTHSSRFFALINIKRFTIH